MKTIGAIIGILLSLGIHASPGDNPEEKNSVLLNRCEVEESNTEKAIEFFSSAINSNPMDGNAYEKRGVLYAKTGKFAKALSDFEYALSINPDNAEAYVHQGIVYYFLEKYTLAFECYTKALDLNPGDPKALYNRGLSLIALDEIDAAYLDLSKAAALNHPHAEDMIWKYCSDHLFIVSR